MVLDKLKSNRALAACLWVLAVGAASCKQPVNSGLKKPGLEEPEIHIAFPEEQPEEPLENAEEPAADKGMEEAESGGVPESPLPDGSEDLDTEAVKLLLLAINMPLEEEIVVAGLPSGAIILSQTGSGGMPRELSLVFEGGGELRCFVDGLQATVKKDGSCQIRAANFTPQRHYLSILAIINNIPYSREIQFTVVR